VTYSETFKEHLAHPRNAGTLADADAEVEQSNPVCGDRLRLALRVRGRRVEAARFLAYGCPPTIVCGSALAWMLEGMTLDEAARVTRAEITEAAGGLPPRKQHAAALAFETLQEALKAVDSSQ
jgi:NifU-like protein involved in Fe-S cluster formation